MRDFAAITALEAFAGALLLVGWVSVSAQYLCLWALLVRY